jgi:hypothetical protein
MLNLLFARAARLSRTPEETGGKKPAAGRSIRKDRFREKQERRET